MRIALATLLTVVWLPRIVGSGGGSPLPIGLGQLTGVAPLPRVFSQRAGVDSLARRAVVEVWTVASGAPSILRAG